MSDIKHDVRKAIDSAADAAKKAVDKTVDATKKAGRDIGEKTKEAGQKIKDASKQHLFPRGPRRRNSAGRGLFALL